MPQLFELSFVYEALIVGDLLNAADLQALTILNYFNELPGLHQGFVSSGIEPGYSPAEYAYIELAG